MQFRNEETMARPTLGDRPMTSAERMRRYRARKRCPDPVPTDTNDCLQRCTRKQQAAHLNMSARQWAYVNEFSRYREIEWDRDVLDGKHGKIGVGFLAWVCKYGAAPVQRLIHDTIKQKGATAGRALWLELLAARCSMTGEE
jgi:hypothetical protein